MRAEAKSCGFPGTLWGVTVLLVVMPEAVAWPDGAALERVEVVAEPITESTDRVGGSRTLINREQLDWLQPQRVEELTALIPGAQPGNLQGGLDSSVMLRGFAITGPRWNGLPDIHRLFVRDPYTAERIEVVSGPDAMLEGVSSPGGVLRYIGKRPQQQPAQEAAITVGSHGHRRLTADTTGPLSDRVAYRLTIAAQEGIRMNELELHRHLRRVRALSQISDQHPALLLLLANQ